jgi:hypothetical protein
MKKLFLLLLVIASAEMNAQITTTLCYEPIGPAVGAKLEVFVTQRLEHNFGVYVSHSRGAYTIIRDDLKFNKTSIGVTTHTKQGPYLQAGIVYSKWVESEISYKFEKRTTGEFGFGYLSPIGINIGVRYNPFKVESSFDIGYTFKLR